VGRKILDLRRGLISEGRIGNEKVVQLFTTMERAPHNPWGIGQDTRQKFIENARFPIFDGSQTWLFWLGCGLSFDSHGHNVALAMKQIFDSAGVSWGVGFNVGGQANASGNWHFLYSAGRDIRGPDRLTAYLGVEYTR
jgi:Fe-S oxidoreductase